MTRSLQVLSPAETPLAQGVRLAPSATHSVDTSVSPSAFRRVAADPPYVLPAIGFNEDTIDELLGDGTNGIDDDLEKIALAAKQSSQFDPEPYKEVSQDIKKVHLLKFRGGATVNTGELLQLMRRLISSGDSRDFTAIVAANISGDLFNTLLESIVKSKEALEITQHVASGFITEFISQLFNELQFNTQNYGDRLRREMPKVLTFIALKSAITLTSVLGVRLNLPKGLENLSNVIIYLLSKAFNERFIQKSKDILNIPFLEPGASAATALGLGSGMVSRFRGGHTSPGDIDTILRKRAVINAHAAERIQAVFSEESS